MLIILLRGYSHSGKDFVGQVLCEKYGFKRYAFADSLKCIVSRKYNCSLDTLHSQEGKLQICKTDPQKRTYRQILLDEALRLKTDNPDIFAEDCSLEIAESGSRRIVITDWRFPNEREVIKKYFPNAKILTIRVLRIGQNKSPVDDESEYLLKNWRDDAVILNYLNNNIYQSVHNILERLNII